MFYKRSLSIDNVYGDFLNFFDIQEYNSKKKMIPEWQIQTQLFCLPKDIMGISFFCFKSAIKYYIKYLSIFQKYVDICRIVPFG